MKTAEQAAITAMADLKPRPNDDGAPLDSTETPQTPATTPTPQFPTEHERDAKWRAAVIGLDESQRAIAKFSLTVEGFCRRAIHNERSKGTWIVVYGPTGVGKTHAGRRVVRFFNSWAVDAYMRGLWGGARTPSAVAVDWPEACKGDFAECESTVRDLRAVDLLLLDDIGAEVDRFKTGATAAMLRDILGMFESRWAFITTNIPRSRWADYWDARVASRLARGAYVDLIGAKDWRKRE